MMRFDVFLFCSVPYIVVGTEQEAILYLSCILSIAHADVNSGALHSECLQSVLL